MTSQENSPAATQEWRNWFDKNGNRLLLFSRQQTRSAADAEDVLQDAIIRLWKWRLNKGEDPNQLPSLAEAYTAIRRTAIDLGRKETRRVKREQNVVEFDDEFGVTWFESSLEEDERDEQLRDAMKELPDKFKEVLTLKIWTGLTFAQIAETLDIPQNTAASRYRYALEALRRKIVGKANYSDFNNMMLLA